MGLLQTCQQDPCGVASKLNGCALLVLWMVSVRETLHFCAFSHAFVPSAWKSSSLFSALQISDEASPLGSSSPGAPLLTFHGSSGRPSEGWGGAGETALLGGVAGAEWRSSTRGEEAVLEASGGGQNSWFCAILHGEMKGNAGNRLGADFCSVHKTPSGQHS